MSQESVREYAESAKCRYKWSSREDKSQILDEFCASTGHERKYAIKLLNGTRRVPRRRGGPKPIYGEKEKGVLKELWLMSDQLCSKLLKPIMPEYIKSYERHCGRLPRSVRKKLLEISPATMDRLLASERVAEPKWRRRPKPCSGVRHSVPVHEGIWAVEEPGWLEADSVPHCGGNMSGSFVWSITYTDIDTGWTECRAVWNRGAHSVLERTREVEHGLPFELLGFDVDNGGEFLNWHLYRYLRERGDPVKMTRSRPYHKNDNAHVEQKNWTHVRQLVGYDRFDDPDLVEALNDLYANEWRLQRNLYCPSMKLISKRREGKRYIKTYAPAKTPAQRILESDAVSRANKTRIRKLQRHNDPWDLSISIELKLKGIFQKARYVERRQAS